MRQWAFLIVLGFTFACSGATGEPAAPRAYDPPIASVGTARPGTLWAGIAVSEPVFVYRTDGRLSVTFALVNDGPATVDPDIDNAELLINGVPYNGSDMMFGNGPRDSRYEALPAGDHLLFGYDLAEVFSKPGSYTLSWRGKHFASQTVELRVLPGASRDAQ